MPTGEASEKTSQRRDPAGVWEIRKAAIIADCCSTEFGRRMILRISGYRVNNVSAFTEYFHIWAKSTQSFVLQAIIKSSEM